MSKKFALSDMVRIVMKIDLSRHSETPFTGRLIGKESTVHTYPRSVKIVQPFFGKRTERGKD
jgi:hypothetical protein